jgi:hypothetical protein
MTTEATPVPRNPTSRDWVHSKYISDMALDEAMVDILALVKDELRASFYATKEAEGWPSGARPIWELRWTYHVEDDYKTMMR